MAIATLLRVLGFVIALFPTHTVSFNIVGDVLFDDSNNGDFCETAKVDVGGRDYYVSNITSINGSVTITATDTGLEANAALCFEKLEIIYGNLNVYEMNAEALTFPVLREVHGDVRIEGTTKLPDFQLESLLKVTGQILVTNNEGLETMMFTKVKGTVAAIHIINNPLLTGADFQNVDVVTGDIYISENRKINRVKFINLTSVNNLTIASGTQHNVVDVLYSIQFPSLTQAYQSINIKYNRYLNAIHFPKLTRCGTVEIKLNTNLIDVDFSVLEAIDGKVFFYRNGNIKTIRFPALQSISRGLEIGYPGDTVSAPENLQVFDFASLQTVQSVYMIALGIPSMSFPSLRNVSGGFAMVQTRLVSSLDVPKATLIGGVLSLSQNEGLVNASFPLLHTVGDLELDANSKMESVAFDNLAITYGVLVTHNDALVELKFPALLELNMAHSKRINISSNGNLWAIDFPVLNQVSRIDIVANSRLRRISLDAVPTLDTLIISDNLEIAFLSMAKLGHVNLFVYDGNVMDSRFDLLLPITSAGELRLVNSKMDSVAFPRLQSATTITVDTLSDVTSLNFSELISVTTLDLDLNWGVKSVSFKSLESAQSLTISNPNNLGGVDTTLSFPVLKQVGDDLKVYSYPKLVSLELPNVEFIGALILEDLPDLTGVLAFPLLEFVTAY
eukprot:m.305950 g.305950  ORF g.305950 m.305950 type:complete len:674 (-) comp16452_c2_seq4:4568-6589(-)